MKTLALALLMFACSLQMPAQAQAEGTTKVKKTTITVKESEKDSSDDEPSASPTPIEEKERVKTATFGSKATSGTLGCKTEELLKPVIKELKADCAAWVKDQKADLKNRFLTSSCEESCSDCGTGLQRCTVTGTVHYIIK